MAKHILTPWLLVFALLSGCATLPEDYPKEPSFAIPASAETPLGRSATTWVESHDGRSGFFPLQSGSDALAARLRMIERAEVSLDAQYFLMKPDIAGHILSQELLLAADRGVRVRFLLDDIFTKVRDEELFILDAHDNIEVRLYNPIAKRGIFVFNFLGDFNRANRRMHNKSFTADNQLTVVGGRNIAAEYFDLNIDTEFEDFDVLIWPGVTVTPFPFDQLYPTEIDGAPMENYVHWAGLTSSLTVMARDPEVMTSAKSRSAPSTIQRRDTRHTMWL